MRLKIRSIAVRIEVALDDNVSNTGEKRRT
jgi:hypothetical protein